VTDSPRVIAHRGASGLRPEHGATAYGLAVEAGADAIEPDVVASRDGVLVLRHENEISATTDVAEHPAFQDRRRTTEVDGVSVTGWFTEDFTWAELQELRIRERLPDFRPQSAVHDGEGRILRLADLLDLLDGDEARSRGTGLVAEIKHPTHFAALGLPLDELFAAEIAAAGWTGDARLTVESFEGSVLERLRVLGVGGRLVWLVEAQGAPFDLVARDGTAATPYARQLTPGGLAALAHGLDGISVPKELLVDAAGAQDSSLVSSAHAAGLEVFTWTLRPENAFLAAPFRLGDRPADHGDWRAELDRIVGTGVDGVFADDPGLVLEALGRGAETLDRGPRGGRPAGA
jgi:glycerophosphoryl diester phosphodiesterase